MNLRLNLKRVRPEDITSYKVQIGFYNPKEQWIGDTMVSIHRDLGQV